MRDLQLVDQPLVEARVLPVREDRGREIEGGVTWRVGPRSQPPEIQPRKPDLVILELGANDMLRGLDPALTRRNLDAIVTELDSRHIKVLVAGMRAAPNLDPAYVSRFEAIYPDLAKRHGAALHPFFMEGVAGQRGMVQPDGMHPTFSGVKRIVTGILPAVKRALGRP